MRGIACLCLHVFWFGCLVVVWLLFGCCLVVFAPRERLSMRMRIRGVTIQLSSCGNFAHYLLWKEVSLMFGKEKRGSVKELKL